jgi:hypothetical protein
MGRSVLLALVRSEIAQEMLDKASAVLFADRAKILRELSRIVMAVESEPADNYYATAGIDPRNIGLKLYRGFESPLSARFSNGSRMSSVPGGGSAGTLAYPRWSNCRGPNPATLAGFTNTLPEPRNNAERMAAIKKQSAPRKARCCGEACVLIALSLVAILATLGAQIAMFDGVSPNSLAPVRNDPKNRTFQKARRFATRWVCSPAPSQPQER